MTPLQPGLGRLAGLLLMWGAMLCMALFAVLVWRHGLSLHYLVMLALAVMLGFSVRLPASFKINIALLGLSTLVSVYGAELLLTYSGSAITSLGAHAWLSFPQDGNVRVAAERMKTVQETHRTFDTRSRLEVVLDMRAHGVMAYPDVFPMVLFAPSFRRTYPIRPRRPTWGILARRGHGHDHDGLLQRKRRIYRL
jgi:hypothetical protein